jgi:uncharacterized damage-inducible protein DinB
MEEAVKELSEFQKEYLWELEIPRQQVLKMAEAVPEEAYGWRPAEDARTFSAVLVHIANGNLMLLHRAHVHTPAVAEVCGEAKEPEGMPEWLAQVHRSVAMERSLTGKAKVTAHLKRSFEEVIAAFTAMNEEELESPREFFFNVPATCRRIFLRILAHGHEHMGQVIAYTRVMGFKVPWPDPVKMMEDAVAGQHVG